MRLTVRACVLSENRHLSVKRVDVKSKAKYIFARLTKEKYYIIYLSINSLTDRGPL